MTAGNQQERPSGQAILRELTPDYITGFVDGEGCFSVSIRPHPSAPHGWLIHPVFQVYQHKHNVEILEMIIKFLGCGTLVPKGPSSDVITLSVHSKKDLVEKVIPFFDEHPFRSKKGEDYSKFREIVFRMRDKEHLDVSGFQELVTLAFQMNARGKQRKYKLEQVLGGILRDCTPDALPERAKIQSELHGDMQSPAEMTGPLAEIRK